MFFRFFRRSKLCFLYITDFKGFEIDQHGWDRYTVWSIFPHVKYLSFRFYRYLQTLKTTYSTTKIRLNGFLSVALILFSSCVFAQPGSMKFKRLNTNHGLSQSFVASIAQDKKGFMWFGTEAGLNKYDGYKFTVYRNNPENASSLRSNAVWSLFVDSKGRMWVGTVTGLDLFDEEKNTFTHLQGNYCIRDILEDENGKIWVCSDEGLSQVDEENQSLITYPFEDEGIVLFRAIYKDSHGHFWVGSRTRSVGAYLFDEKRKTFTLVEFPKRPDDTSYEERVSDIFEDSFGVVWFSTSEGLISYNHKNKAFVRYRHDDSSDNRIGHSDVRCLAEDVEGNLWVGHAAGISLFDPSRRKVSSHRYDIDDPDGLSENFVTTIFKDKSNNLWLGSRNTGLNIYRYAKNDFKLYAHRVNDPRSLNNNVVKAILKDRKGRLWLGTDGGGLNLLKDDGSFVAYTHNPKDPKSIPNNLVLAMYEDKQDNFWVSTFYGALSKFDREKGTFEHIYPGTGSADLNSVSVSVMLEDSRGNFWVGTWYNGLFLFDRAATKFKNYSYDGANDKTISSGDIVAIYEDSRGNLWIGTTNGLNRFNYETNDFTRYFHNENDKNSISDNSINSIAEDNDGNLLIGTTNGLNIFNHETGTFRSYSTKDGLVNNVIHGAVSDDEGNIWMSTLNGVCKFNPQTLACRNYGVADGLQGNEFIRHSYFKSKSGEIYFGGNFGANCIMPKLIKPNLYVPPIVLTDFKIFNESAGIGENPPDLQQHVSYTKTIQLSYRESVFSFEFAALDFTNPSDNQYAYQLVGFDKNWNYVGNKNSATYTNLNAGEYVFKVIGTNNDGVWNKEGVSVKVIITPPFWLTTWFKVLATVVVAMSFVIYIRARLSIINKQKAELQRQVLERTRQLAASTEEAELARQDAEQANRAKSVFLATMSHEIRTPMNGVLGMASLLAETPLTSEQREYANIIKNSGEALLDVINDILDFSKIESGRMELEENNFNLGDCIEEVLDMFAVQASQSQLDLIYEIDSNVPVQVIGDSLRLRQVLLNLISNAIKFTPQGEIFLGVSLVEKQDDNLLLKFIVRDTGIGIPKDKFERLFKPFSQVDSSTTRKYGGTGLGLAISEKLVALMGGKIEVESKPASGTKFTFTLNVKPDLKNAFADKHVAVPGLSGKRALVVDDNSTCRDVLKRQLERWNFVVTVAASGDEVLDLITNQKLSFDLLITDMQMPQMDGLELARVIRKDDKRLPIILLSSMVDRRVEQDGPFTSVIAKPIRHAALHKHLLSIFVEEPNTLAGIKEEKKTLTNDFAKQYPLTILIAEDNPVNQKLAERVLGKLGYVTGKVFNGREAVEAQKLNHYDVILMDVQMPEMDGLEATKQIRQHCNRQPVIIAMTANAMQGDREMCINAGMDDYISKPFNQEELVEVLKKWASKKTGVITVL